MKRHTDTVTYIYKITFNTFYIKYVFSCNLYDRIKVSNARTVSSRVVS